MAKLKPRELKDMEIGEVSLVDKAANKKKFLFYKQQGEGRGVGGDAQGDGGVKYCVCPDCGYSEEHKQTGEGKSIPCTKIKCPECGTLMKGSNTKMLKKKKKLNIVIDSDGTVGGTKIILNGDEIEKMKDFSFSFWTSSDMDSPVSCFYSKEVENDDGFSRSETFQLSKGEHTMNEEIKKQVEVYFGENQTVDFKKAVEDDVIIKSLETVIEYLGDFPDDLKKAVGSIVKQAALYSPVKVEKSDNEDGATDIEKAGAKLSKDTLKKLTDALSALKSLLPEIKQNVEKSDNDKAIEELQKTIESLEKKSEPDDDNKATKLLEDLAKRLATVEKNSGVKKSLDGQEANSGNEASGAKWPSLLESAE